MLYVRAFRIVTILIYSFSLVNFTRNIIQFRSNLLYRIIFIEFQYRQNIVKVDVVREKKRLCERLKN
jgi:hypothetical protein